MGSLKKNLHFVILVFSLVFGGFLRFYNIDWGQGYHFHPDEYHIVAAVGRLINSGLFTDPDLYSYGSFSIYLIYFVRKLLLAVAYSAPDIFIIGRALAAFFSTITLINIYLIARNFFRNNKVYPALAALTAAYVSGLIQQAHFLTPESFMTFWITLSVYFFIKHFNNAHKYKYLLISAMSLGLAGATKISSFVALPFLLLFLIFTGVKKSTFVRSLQKAIVYVFTLFIFYFLAFPYSLLSWDKFINTTKYESSLSAGSIKVFYTRAFEGTQPFLFQLKDIYPYTLGIVLLIFAFVGFILAIQHIFMKNSEDKIPHSILIGTFLSYFIFNSLLFTKWTRFVHPTIPFLVIFAFIAIYKISPLIKNRSTGKYFAWFFSGLLILSTMLWGEAFFSLYKKDDVRITATKWVNENLPKNSIILSETGNTLEVPLWGGYNITPFDFYNLDRDSVLVGKLTQRISLSDYFIIQSRRIYLNHNDKSKYPYVYNFYNALFSGKLGFEEVSVINSYPGLNIGDRSVNFPDEFAEETWSVFDHPVIRIFKKSIPNTQEYYEQILRQ